MKDCSIVGIILAIVLLFLACLPFIIAYYKQFKVKQKEKKYAEVHRLLNKPTSMYD